MPRLQPAVALTLALVLATVGFATGSEAQQSEQPTEPVEESREELKRRLNETEQRLGEALRELRAARLREEELRRKLAEVVDTEAPVRVRAPLGHEESDADRISRLDAELERSRQDRVRLQVELAAARREATTWRRRAEALAEGGPAAAGAKNESEAPQPQSGGEVVAEMATPPAGEPAPEPVTAPPPEPAAAPQPETSQAPAETPPSPAEQAIQAVRAWADAWSGKRVDEYLARYASGFRPPRGLTRAAWEAQRRERLAAPRFIRVEIGSPQAQPRADGSVRVSFRQEYESDSYRDEVSKLLILVEENSTWRILSEQTLP